MGSIDPLDQYTECNELDRDHSEKDFTIGAFNRKKYTNKRGISMSSRHEYEQSRERRLTINQSAKNMFESENDVDLKASRRSNTIA